VIVTVLSALKAPNAHFEPAVGPHPDEAGHRYAFDYAIERATIPDMRQIARNVAERMRT